MSNSKIINKAQLARALGVTRQCVGQWFKRIESPPSLARKEQMATLLGITIDELNGYLSGATLSDFTNNITVEEFKQHKPIGSALKEWKREDFYKKLKDLEL